MSGFVDSYEDQLLDLVLRNQSFVPPTTVYVALFTTAPSDDGTGGVEVSGGGYTRMSVTFSAASGGSISNSGVIEFPAATASWGTVTSMGLYTASTAGSLIMFGNLSASQLVDTNTILRFPAASIVVTLD